MEDTVYRKVGQRIRFFRKRLGMTVDTLAEKVGVARLQIVRLEAGLSGTSLARLQRIAEVLCVSLVDLMPPPADTPEQDWDDYLQLAFRGSGLTKEETEKVLEYARMLRIARRETLPTAPQAHDPKHTDN